MGLNLAAFTDKHKLDLTMNPHWKTQMQTIVDKAIEGMQENKIEELHTQIIKPSVDFSGPWGACIYNHIQKTYHDITLPAGWYSAVDTTSGRTYYLDGIKTQWEIPTAFRRRLANTPI